MASASYKEKGLRRGRLTSAEARKARTIMAAVTKGLRETEALAVLRKDGSKRRAARDGMTLVNFLSRSGV